MNRLLATLFVVAPVVLAPGAAHFVYGQDTPPATQPADAEALPLIAATDEAALKEAVGKDARVWGTVRQAEWSESGKVMNVEFEGNEDSRFMVSTFARQRAELDEAFGGSLATFLQGKLIEVSGPVKTFRGPVNGVRDRIEIVIREPGQIKVLQNPPA
ncbi:MAG: hypothetical protein ACFCVE_05910 [Phycisphaerae bacterium]